MSKTKVATITFANAAQLALFTSELDGQISDGHWENSGPNEHWVFWHSIDHAIGPNVGVVPNGNYRAWDRTGCKKNNYNFMSKFLLECVQDRMLKTARLGMCVDASDIPTFIKLTEHVADELPETLEEYEEHLAGKPFRHPWQEESVRALPVEVVKKYYSTVYTVKDLHKDLRQIKKICKTMPTNR